MDDRRWEDLNMDCLVKVFEQVGMESLLLDVPFVCKSWYRASLHPLCWKCLIFPDNECRYIWSYDVEFCRDFENLLDRFARKYQKNKNRTVSVTAFIKLVINRSYGNATVLKLPKCCTVEAFEFAANVCPKLVTLGFPENVLFAKQTNLDLIGKWENLEVLCLRYASKNLKKLLALVRRHCKKFRGLDLSKTIVEKRQALAIVKFVPNIKYLNLNGAAVKRGALVTLLRGCKDLEVFDARDCCGFQESDDEISKLASHICNFMCDGSGGPETVSLDDVLYDRDHGLMDDDDDYDMWDDGMLDDDDDGDGDGDGDDGADDDDDDGDDGDDDDDDSDGMFDEDDDGDGDGDGDGDDDADDDDDDDDGDDDDGDGDGDGDGDDDVGMFDED